MRMCPPDCLTNPCTMARPRPDPAPVSLVVKNGSGCPSNSLALHFPHLASTNAGGLSCRCSDDDGGSDGSDGEAARRHVARDQDVVSPICQAGMPTSAANCPAAV